MKKISSQLGLGFWLKNFSFFSGLGIPRFFFLFLLISLKWIFLRGGLVLVLFVSMVLFVSRSKKIFLFYFFTFPDFWVLSLLVVEREHFLWWLSGKESNAASVRVRVLDGAFARLSSETLVCGFSFSCKGIISYFLLTVSLVWILFVLRLEEILFFLNGEASSQVAQRTQLKLGLGFWMGTFACFSESGTVFFLFG